MPDSSLVDEIAVAAKSRPDHPALITPMSTLTWAEVDARVEAAARRLVMLARPRERVAIVLGNSVDFVIT